MKRTSDTPAWKKYIEAPLSPAKTLRSSSAQDNNLDTIEYSDLPQRLPEESFKAYINRISN